MSYDISKILKLPVAEQEEIANAILTHLHSLGQNEDNNTELDNRFIKIESGDYTGYSIEDIKNKLSAKWQSK